MRQPPKLTRKLVLEERQRVPDGGGGATENWTALGSHWGALRAVAAREATAGGRPVSRVTHELFVRGAPPGSPRRPTADQRFRMGSRVFAVRGVSEADDSAGWLRCWVEEGVLP